jgi:hypothetical protein
MRIDPTTERWTRDILGHAIRGELAQLRRLIDAIGDAPYLECVALSIAITAYVAIDASGMRWPGEPALRELARHVAETTTEFELSETSVFDFLSRVVFGEDKLDQVFPDLTVATTLPVLAAGRILGSFRPHRERDENWWDYLDVIEEALETAASLGPPVLPALMWQSRRSITALPRGPRR